jgi:hypothetical protein
MYDEFFVRSLSDNAHDPWIKSLHQRGSQDDGVVCVSYRKGRVQSNFVHRGCHVAFQMSCFSSSDRSPTISYSWALCASPWLRLSLRMSRSSLGPWRTPWTFMHGLWSLSSWPIALPQRCCLVAVQGVIFLDFFLPSAS